MSDPLSTDSVAKEAPPLSPDAELRVARQELLNQIDALHPGTYGDNLRLMEAIEGLILAHVGENQ